MVVHELKTWPVFFQALIDGSKTFELRRDDRLFAVGDELDLREWDPDTEDYTGREARTVVTYVLRGHVLRGAIYDGWAVLGIRHPWSLNAPSRGPS